MGADLGPLPCAGDDAKAAAPPPPPPAVPGSPAAPAAKVRLPDLRLATLKDGLRDARARSKGKATDADKAAKAVGLDLDAPAHPLVAHRFLDRQVFYVFYKTTENAFGDRSWVLQRIKKTERSWPAGADAKPEVKVTYLVEAFKTLGGVLKGEDQHYGHFHLGDFARREIVKEYEIGFGEVSGVGEGVPWPFAEGTLYQRIQPYQEEIGLYAKTALVAARRWSLTVSFDASGTYRVASPELGFDLPSTPLDPAVATPSPDPTSKDLVLEPGVGAPGVRIGESTADDLVRALGAPLEDVPAGKDHRLLSFARSITCNLDPAGKLKTVITRPGFAGRTTTGVAHGLARADVKKLLGAPEGAKADAEVWAYDGVQVSFDGFERVSRIVLFRRKG